MIIAGPQMRFKFLCGYTMGDDVVSSLQIEGFLNFGMRRKIEMEKDQGRHREREKDIYLR